MHVVAIIPARYASTRLNGKPLLNIAGKPMIQWVYERAKKAKLTNDVIAATDDKRVFDAVRYFGGTAVMTSPEHRTGTDRIAEAADGLNVDIIVNVQGDEPLIEPEMIDEAIRPLTNDSEIVAATLKTKIRDEAELNNPNVVKVVTDKNDFALYFSRLPVPYYRDEWKDLKHLTVHGSRFTVFKHIGLYVYRKDFLLKFAKMKPTPLEEAEKLEQLRVLENGYKIKVVETEHDSIGVDTEEDMERVRKIVIKNHGRT